MPDWISAGLRQVLRRLRLSPVLDILPEGCLLARHQQLPHQDFLELVLADEVARQDRLSGDRRAQTAHLDPALRLETWDASTGVTFDHLLWNELRSLRFLEEAADVCILGPVGVGKTRLASSLGHLACRRRHSVLFTSADQCFKRLKAARLDATYDQELRRLIRVDLLLLDDFGLQGLDAVETHDFAVEPGSPGAVERPSAPAPEPGERVRMTRDPWLGWLPAARRPVPVADGSAGP